MELLSSLLCFKCIKINMCLPFVKSTLAMVFLLIVFNWEFFLKKKSPKPETPLLITLLL